MRVGLIGCGVISEIYFENADQFPQLEIVACADRDHDRAEASAQSHDGIRAMALNDLLADKSIDCVLNLTPPTAHAEVTLDALSAGKHVYTEKPLALTLEDGQRILDEAAARNLRVGVAPDTFLGAGIQTCRQAIASGLIGTPVSGEAFMLGHGNDHWHPNLEFFYQPGGGPVFDMAPYYLTTLHFLLGPIATVSSMTSRAFDERTITAEHRFGERIPVNVATHASATLRYVSGPLITLVMSFDVWAHELPWIEVHGTEGSLSMPDPNYFEGPVRLKRHDDPDWREFPLTHANAFNARGLGLADLSEAISNNRPHRANAEVAFHVLEAMHAIDTSAESGRHVDVNSSPPPPAPLREGLNDREIAP
jgi:predicted dehydrogenase